MDREAVVRKFRTTASDGKNYQVMYYNIYAYSNMNRVVDEMFKEMYDCTKDAFSLDS